MSKVAVVYWSSTGNTEEMAKAVAQGARGAGAGCDLMTCDQMNAAKAAQYDALLFGCPAMGAETLEEDEFQPMFDAVKPALKGKKVALFGSYGWGGGEWMQTWEADCAAAGITLAHESVICNEAPDDDGIAACKALGAALA
ncbi:MAG: flavodoxin [Oscillospiraceae bacterium]|nr:flavodoxin [Oscillospiraceae bacterium]